MKTVSGVNCKQSTQNMDDQNMDNQNLGIGDKRFLILLTVLIAIGVMLTIGHFCYVIFAYKNASIIYFISGELWW